MPFKSFLVAIVATFSVSLAVAQPSIGVGVGMTKHLGEYFIDLNPTGRVNAFCLIRFKDKLVGKFGATYTFMAKDKSQYTLYSQYPGIAPQRDVNYTFSLHGPSVNAQARYYVVGDYYSPINMYVPFELGLHMLFAEGRLDKFNEALYDKPDWYDGPEKELLLGYSIGAGIGAEFQIGLPVMFIESQFVFPVNSVNGQPVEPKVPMHVVFDVGIRVPLDGNYHPGARYRHRRR